MRLKINLGDLNQLKAFLGDSTPVLRLLAMRVGEFRTRMEIELDVHGAVMSTNFAVVQISHCLLQSP